MRFFFFRFCDDEFTGGAERDVVLGAKFLGQAIPFHTMPSFPGIFWVIDAGVDNAAVARAGGHAESWILLDEKDVLPAAGERFGDGATDNTAADDQNVDRIHGFIGYDR